MSIEFSIYNRVTTMQQPLIISKQVNSCEINNNILSDVLFKLYSPNDRACTVSADVNIKENEQIIVWIESDQY